MSQLWRTLRWSAWLGWQIESNWTDPIRFAIYLVIKPLTGSLLLIFMVQAAQASAPGRVPPQLLAFAFFGNAIYMLIGAVAFGMSAAVITDREHYGMLKYIRLSPVGSRAYLIGRGLASGSGGMIGALCTLLAGLFLPIGLRGALHTEGIAIGWLLVYLGLGVVMLLSLGLILAGTVLNMARHGMFLSEGVGSMLYLLCGAIFPLDRLPMWMQAVGLTLPPTYWMEGMRRSLLGTASRSGPLAAWDHMQLAGALLFGTIVMAAIANVYFNWCERRRAFAGGTTSPPAIEVYRISPGIYAGNAQDAAALL